MAWVSAVTRSLGPSTPGALLLVPSCQELWINQAHSGEVLFLLTGWSAAGTPTSTCTMFGFTSQVHADRAVASVASRVVGARELMMRIMSIRSHKSILDPTDSTWQSLLECTDLHMDINLLNIFYINSQTNIISIGFVSLAQRSINDHRVVFRNAWCGSSGRRQWVTSLKTFSIHVHVTLLTYLDRITADLPRGVQPVGPPKRTPSKNSVVSSRSLPPKKEGPGVPSLIPRLSYARSCVFCTHLLLLPISLSLLLAWKLYILRKNIWNFLFCSCLWTDGLDLLKMWSLVDF